MSAMIENNPAENASAVSGAAVGDGAAGDPTTKIPRALLEMAPALVETYPQEDGSLIMRSPLRLGAPPRRLLDGLHQHAEAAPARIFLADRSGPGGWRTVSY